MNNRGQAALEYLMTYGWALVIIVVVAGILFFIISSPAGGVSCTSSDPAKMAVQAANIPATGTANVKVLNGTGGTITNVSIGPGGSFSSVTTPPTSANGGAVLNLTPVCSGGCGTGPLDANTSLTIVYKDQFDYEKTVTVTCQGTPV
ncbi:MAG: hypothetical protein JW772_00410 [Candidatus Diapherotrites archaeon]|nr:hypothetical protein [Candidatus Diapherotrites archaeon]